MIKTAAKLLGTTTNKLKRIFMYTKNTIATNHLVKCKFNMISNHFVACQRETKSLLVPFW